MMKIPFPPLTNLGICALVLLLATTGCTRQKDAEIRIAYGVVWNGSPYEVGESAPDVQGRPVQLERLECYVSDFAIHDVDEGWLPIDTVARIDFSKDNAHAVLTKSEIDTSEEFNKSTTLFFSSWMSLLLTGSVLA